MAKINNMEMAQMLSQQGLITVKSSFFGLKKSYIYVPTGSMLSGITNEYNPQEGEQLIRLAQLSPEQMNTEVTAKGKPQPTPVGHIRMELCASADHQYVAFSIYRFVDFAYQPIFPPRCFEGAQAELVYQALV